MGRYSVGVGIILERDSKLLLGKRSAHRYAGGIWEFPSGRIEPSEEIEDAVKREAMEELGVEVVPIQIINAYQFERDNSPFILLNYYCSFSGQPRRSDEHDELRWVEMRDVMELLYFPEQKSTLEQYCKMRNYL